MTSNVGARLITEKKTIGFDAKDENSSMDYETIKKDVLNETRMAFKPEFLNRIDELIVFHKLSLNDLKQITDKMLEKVIERIKKQGLELEITEAAREIIIEKGIDYKYGARPLRRTIQSLVEDKVAETILEGELKEEKKIVLDGEDKEIFVSNWLKTKH